MDSRAALSRILDRLGHRRRGRTAYRMARGSSQPQEDDDGRRDHHRSVMVRVKPRHFVRGISGNQWPVRNLRGSLNRHPVLVVNRELVRAAARPCDGNRILRMTLGGATMTMVA